MYIFRATYFAITTWGCGSEPVRKIGPFYVNCARKELERIDNNSDNSISLKDALEAMKALGLNPAEQEMIDMTNEVNNNGLIYYPDFCKLVLRKYREESKGWIKIILRNLNWKAYHKISPVDLCWNFYLTIFFISLLGSSQPGTVQGKKEMNTYLVDEEDKVIEMWICYSFISVSAG